MIYYGLNLISPSYFLIAALLICSIVSTATGTAWGTSGTVGIALMGIGTGLGIPAPITAGFVISGACFGDKISPLSDTTNLAPAMAGTDLFQHIRALMWTTVPTYLIVIVISLMIGSRYTSGGIDVQNIEAIQALIKAEFSISLLGLAPPLLVIVMAMCKMPAIPAVSIGVLAGAFLALFHGAGIGFLFEVLQNGYKSALSTNIVNAGQENLAVISAILSEAKITGVSSEYAFKAATTLNELLTRGGLQSMNFTISLILCALCFGCILDKCGFLEVLLEPLLHSVKTVGGLVTSVLASCFATNVCAADQYVSLVLPGRMFKEKFDKWGLHPRMLSRSLEDGGTLTSSLVPWNTCGLDHAKVLGVSTMAYAPYAFLNWMTLIVAIVITYIGIGIAWRKNNEEGFVLSRTKPESAD
jgi:NhaC family Na+:H+ antiporter